MPGWEAIVGSASRRFVPPLDAQRGQPGGHSGALRPPIGWAGGHGGHLEAWNLCLVTTRGSIGNSTA